MQLLKSSITPRWPLVILIALVAMLAPMKAALAQEDAVQIYQGQTEAYQVRVEAQPRRLIVGTVHFTIFPVDAATLEPVTDAHITIVASNPEGIPTYQSRALNTPQARGIYVSNLTFTEAGQWSLLLKMEGSTAGDAQLTFPLNIEPQVFNTGLAGTILWVLVFLALVAGATYVWYSSRRIRRAGGSAAASP